MVLLFCPYFVRNRCYDSFKHKKNIFKYAKAGFTVIK